jgi:MFS transporter, AAHS family, 4-hydroxybenzoate transporter
MTAVSTSTTIDIAAHLDHGTWTGYQKRVVLLAALAIVFDGFDSQLLGFAIPAMLRDWHVARAAFSPIVALGLIGMGLGSAIAGFVGDRVGRRAALIGAVLVFSAGTFGSAGATGMTSLAVYRFIAGVGLGGVFPNATAFAAEFAPLARRAVSVSVTIVCVPVGGMIAGLFAAPILPSLGWRALFLVGGTLPLILAVVLCFLMPESARYLVRVKKRWPELGRLLVKMERHVPGNAEYGDSAAARDEASAPLSNLFGSGRIRDTICIWMAFLFSLLTVFTVFSWLPAMLAAQGLDLAAASNGLTCYNVGGIAGVLLCGALIARFGSRVPMLAACIGGAASVWILTMMPIGPHGDRVVLLAAFTVHGFFVNAVQVSAFALAAHLYPAKVRATGVAFAYTFGRVGPLVSAFTGALLIQAGRTAFLNSLAISMLATFVALALIKNHIPRPSRT